jgi:hypothetical protein
MSSQNPATFANNLVLNIFRFTAHLGNVLTILGCLGLLLGVLDVFDMNRFAIGLSSGIRIIGTVAIAGCLLSAIGYGALDYFKK